MNTIRSNSAAHISTELGISQNHLILKMHTLICLAIENCNHMHFAMLIRNLLLHVDGLRTIGGRPSMTSALDHQTLDAHNNSHSINTSHIRYHSIQIDIVRHSIDVLAAQSDS